MSLLLLLKFPRSSSVTATTQVAVDCTSPVNRIAVVDAQTQVAVDCTSPITRKQQLAPETSVAVSVESTIGKVLQLAPETSVVIDCTSPKGVGYAVNLVETAVSVEFSTARAQNIASTTQLAVESTSPTVRVQNVESTTEAAVAVESVVTQTVRESSTGDGLVSFYAPALGTAVLGNYPVAGIPVLYDQDRGPVRPEIIMRAIKNKLVESTLFTSSCVFIVTDGGYFSPSPPGDRYAVIYTGDGNYDQSHLAGAGVESNLAVDNVEIRVFTRLAIDRYTRADNVAASLRFSALRLARAAMKQLQMEDLRTSTTNAYLLAQPMRCTRKPRVENTRETDFAAASVVFEVIYTLDVTLPGLIGVI